MSTNRRFLILSSLGRLIRKERGASQVTEGYFPNHPGRSSHVQVEGGNCSLILVTTAGNAMPVEERTDVPRAHADALLDVAPGKVVYDRSRMSLAGREICIDRFSVPSALDLISVAFDTEEEARSFRAPPWFGTELTGEQSYQNRSIALEGAPTPPDLPLSNSALESLLDALENRFAAARARPGPQRNQQAQAGGNSLARLAASPFGEVAAAAPVKADEEQPEPEPAPEQNGSENIEDDVIRELARALGR